MSMIKIKYKFEDRYELDEAVYLYEKDKEECIKRYGLIKDWDVSKINDMSHLFSNMREFNEDISKWDVSNVLDMRNMFSNCEKFNQSLKEWDVRKVRLMNSMFYKCKNYKEDLRNWDIRNVIEDDFIFLESGKDSF